jgi:hypothetical protein
MNKEAGMCLYMHIHIHTNMYMHTHIHMYIHKHRGGSRVVTDSFSSRCFSKPKKTSLQSVDSDDRDDETEDKKVESDEEL